MILATLVGAVEAVGALLALLALLVVALLAFSYWRARVLLTPVRSPYQMLPEQAGLAVEDVRFPGTRGTLAGWYLPARNGCTLICCHGINDNRSQWVEQVARLHERGGYGALLFDFAGHGQSEGSQVTYGAREQLDVAAAIAYLAGRGDVNMRGLGLLGYSLGAIAGVLAAAEHLELRAVVIESGFADLVADLALLFHRFTGLPSFPFANLIVFWGQIIGKVSLSEIRPARVIGRISPRAVFVIVDLLDGLANEPANGTLLYESAGEPKAFWLVPESGHVAAFRTAPEEWVQRVGDFLDRNLAAPVAAEVAQATETATREQV